jgi:hypothetical protein
MKQYIKLINIVAGILIGAFFVNKYGLNFLQSWSFEYNQVVIEYLKVFLGWPAVVFLIFSIFFSRFYSAIDYFIRNMRVKYKDVEATSQQAKNILPDGARTSETNEAEVIRLSKQDVQTLVEEINNIQSDNQTKQQTIDTLRELAVQLANRSELFEFKYLNEILVLNTKIVLRDLYIIGSMTRESFIRNIFVPSSVIDKFSEQLAIHNALLVNGLIEEAGSLIKVSEKGERYLKFLGLIKND